MGGIGDIINNKIVVTSGACLAGCIAGGLIMKIVTSKKSPETLPEKWIKVGMVRELRIFPVKGFQPVPVQEAILGRIGLRDTKNENLRDRVFAIINEGGTVVNMRQHPIFACVKVTFVGHNMIRLSTKDANDIEFDIPKEGSAQLITAKRHEERIRSLDCGDQVAEWICNLAKAKGLRLIYHFTREGQRGSAKRNERFPDYTGSDAGTFHDETSYMLMTDESIQKLNDELDADKKPFSHDNFRATILVNEIPEPFSEDNWGLMRIGRGDEAPVLKASRPCVRCAATTVDVDIGEFREDGEPLRTLNRLTRLRTVGSKGTTKQVAKTAVLGAHFGIFKGTDEIIKVGDPIYAAVV